MRPRASEKIGEFMLRLEITGSDYRFHPLVHVLRVRKEFAERPTNEQDVPQDVGSLERISLQH
uniref:Uncharacterized protein n=1 Tax=Globisporangium ultimum (strain ATCC 200006 / CBS 805.95 / DAOM BR144) TaxID=431595 RepID=K3WYI9_GLOUD